MLVSGDHRRQELLQLSVGRAHRRLTIRLLEEIPDLLSVRFLSNLDPDGGRAAEGDSTHCLFVVAVPRLGVGHRAGLTNSPLGAGRLQVSMHEDMPFPVVGTGEDGGDGGERVGRHE